jgi:hypothetical protein
MFGDNFQKRKKLVTVTRWLLGTRTGCPIVRLSQDNYDFDKDRQFKAEKSCSFEGIEG